MTDSLSLTFRSPCLRVDLDELDYVNLRLELFCSVENDQIMN